MPRFSIFRLGYWFFSLIALAVIVSGCGESKISQCNRLVKILNQAKAVAVPEDAAAQATAADSVDRLREQAQTEILIDPKVKSLQGQIVEHLSEASQLLRQASKASSNRDLTLVTKNKQATQAFMDKEQPLLAQLNSYCAE